MGAVTYLAALACDALFLLRSAAPVFLCYPIDIAPLALKLVIPVGLRKRKCLQVAFPYINEVCLHGLIA
jgi:hypothetical protein